MKYRIVRVLGSVVAVALLAGIWAAPARGAEKIKIAVPAASTTFAPLYHASAAGYFAEEGLDIEVVIVPAAGSLQAVLSRDVDFALAPGTHQLVAHERGQRLVAVMSILTRLSVNIVMHKDVARERGITEKSPLADKIRALKGLKMSGLTVGAFAHQVVVHYLLKAGLDPHKDVDLVGLGTAPAVLAALEKRHIDAFVGGTPVPEAAAARGFGLMVVDNSAGEDPDFAEFMMNAVTVHPEWARQNPDTVRKVVRALLRGNAWIMDNSAEAAVPSMKPFLGRLDDKILIAGLAKVRLGIPRDGRITERAAASTQEFLKKIGQLKATIPYGELVTNEYLPK